MVPRYATIIGVKGYPKQSINPKAQSTCFGIFFCTFGRTGHPIMKPTQTVVDTILRCVKQ